MMNRLTALKRACLLSAVTFALSGTAFAPPTTAPASNGPEPIRPGDLTLKPIVVTAQLREEPLQQVPESVSVISGQTIQDDEIREVKDAARYVPNLNLQYFTNQRLSFPFIRGIGSGQGSPAVTTYIDGVPQLSFATSNQQLFGVDRIEFLRGPQGTLYVRNTLGGVINIITHKPTNTWERSVETTFGNFGLQDYRGSVSGPIVKDNLYLSLSGGYRTRDGYSTNNFTNHDLDGREDYFGRASLRWTPSEKWEILLSFNGERDRDGDYPLYDIGYLHDHPNRAFHDFEGGTERDVIEPSLVINYFGQNVEMNFSSSYQYWRSRDTTDVDETPIDAARRDNKEHQIAWIEELRFSSPTERPLVINNDTKLSWVGGVFFFASTDNQRVVNDIRPGGVGPGGAPFPFQQLQNSDTRDIGIAFFGQTTLTLWDKLDFIVGLRYDYQRSRASLDNANSTPLIPASPNVDSTRDFYRLSPKFGVGYHFTKDLMVYGSATEGYRAGGFNSTAPTGTNPSFDQETSWTYELGVKSSWLKNRLIVNADVFYINWDDVQLDLPNGSPSQFFIANAGKAKSAGAEVEVTFRPVENLDLFAGIGVMNTRFDTNIPGAGIARGNDLPFAPDVTWNVGAQYSMKVYNSLRAFARAEVFGVGKYYYDPSNNAAQTSYALTNLRLGVTDGRWRLEGFIDNVFNTHYIPLAFPFPSASGYVGESGAPTTFGITLGVNF